MLREREPSPSPAAAARRRSSPSFAAAGRLLRTLTVTDGEGAVGTASTVDGLPAFVVVYDPSAGFVTGGGWITSPAGAYAPTRRRPARLRSGSSRSTSPVRTKPDGNTEFHFTAAGFDFSSTTLRLARRRRHQGAVPRRGHRQRRPRLPLPPDRLRREPRPPPPQGLGRVECVVYDNRRGAADDLDAPIRRRSAAARSSFTGSRLLLMRRLLALASSLVLALAGGCGRRRGDETGGAHPRLPPGPDATDACLGEHGFSLRPAASGVSAVSPSGAS